MQLNASQIAAVYSVAMDALRQVKGGAEPDFYRDYQPTMKRALRDAVEYHLAGTGPLTKGTVKAIEDRLFVGIVEALRGEPAKISFEQELEAAGSPGEVVEPDVADEKKIVDEKPEAPKKPRAKKKASKKKAKS